MIFHPLLLCHNPFPDTLKKSINVNKKKGKQQAKYTLSIYFYIIFCKSPQIYTFFLQYCLYKKQINCILDQLFEHFPPIPIQESFISKASLSMWTNTGEI